MPMPRKPTALRLLEGNRSKRPLPQHEPQPEPLEDLAPPEHLPADAAAVWVELAGKLRAVGLLTVLDVPAFESLCSALATARRATRELAEGELVVFDESHKRWKRNAWTTIQAQALGRAQSLLAEFGMTPASRSRVTAPPPAAGGDIGGSGRFFP